MIGIDPKDTKAMQDHHAEQLAVIRQESREAMHKRAESMRIGLPVVFAATSSDKRVIDLVAQFNAADERGRNTMLRMAQVMPKGAL